MNKYFALFLIQCTMTVGLVAQPQRQGGTTAITHVSIIDGNGGPVTADATVLIVGRQIDKIGKSSTLTPPAGARIVDGKGKYLIPGLWDMHVHWYDKSYLPLFIANGVTGIRHMWGAPDHFQWRKEIAAGALLGPRMVIPGPIVDGPNPIWEGSISVSGEQDSREVVRKIKNDGYEFVKVYSLLSRDAFFAIADETKKLGIPFAGHVPVSVNAGEASDAGQKSIEHLTGLLDASSTSESDLRSQREELLRNRSSNQRLSSPEKMRPLTRLMLDSFSREKASALFKQLHRNRTWQCPTLVVLRNTASLEDTSFRLDPRLKYMPSTIRSSWNPANDFRFKDRAAEDFRLAKEVYRKQVEVVAMMHDEGMDFIAGTDALNPYCFPGFSLHDELGLLVSAGLTPMEALQAATRNPALYLGTSDSLGTIARGKIADLVLLDENPLTDISNTKKIYGVFNDGKYLSRQTLDSALTAIERIANRKSIAGLMLEMMKTQDLNAAIAKYRELKASGNDEYEFAETELNVMAYQLLQMKKIKEAIEILKLNVEAYPKSSNAYDSLGEAYMTNGDFELAISNYTRSIELDPSNMNAAEKLKQLKK